MDKNVTLKDLCEDLNARYQNKALYAQHRINRLKGSGQLTLGELLMKFNDLYDKDLHKPIRLDHTDIYPSGVCSWRGNYTELAICYNGAHEPFARPEDTKHTDPMFGSYFISFSHHEHVILTPKFTTWDFIRMLETIQGNYLQGWKGGDFLMDKDVPVWVANPGESCGYLGYPDEYDSELDEPYTFAVVDIEVSDKYIHLITKPVEE